MINSLYISLVLILFIFCFRFFKNIFFMVIKRSFCVFFARSFLSAFFYAFLLFLIGFFAFLSSFCFSLGSRSGYLEYWARMDILIAALFLNSL